MAVFDSVEGIDPSEFGCIYSPAERRGPAPRNTAKANDSSSKSDSSRDDCCDNVKSVEFPLSTYGNDGTLNNSTEQRDPIFVSVSGSINSTQQTSSRVNGLSDVQPPLIHHVHIDPTESTKKSSYSQYHRISLKSWIVKAIHSIRINTNGQYSENNNITSHITSSRYLESALQIASSLTNQIVQAEEKYGQTGEEVEMLSLPPVSVGRDWAAYVTVQLKDVVPGSGNGSDLEDSKTTAAVSSFASHGGNDNDWVNTHVEVDLEEKKEIAAAAAALPSLTSNELKGGNNRHLEEEKEIAAAAAPSLTTNDSSKPKAEQMQYINGHDLTLFYQALGDETDAPHENHGGLDDNDLNKELDSFLRSIEREVSPPTNTGGEAIMQSPFDATNSDEVDAELTALYQSAGTTGDLTGGSDNFDPLEGIFGEVQNAAAQGNPSGINPTNVDLNYLDIDSAEIQCPTGNLLKKNDNVVNENLRRIYYLGLVFYELFTGGEIPSDDLFTLPTCENAFVSLSHLTLLNKNNEDKMSIGDTNKRHQGQSSSNLRLCESSCEYLRLMGITGPICDLIFNMLDSVHGYLSGNESYTNMAQVAYDLQLMIDKPSKFQRGLDMDKVSVSGLPINDIDIPREEEFEAIKSCYNRSISGLCEIAIIRGESGTGKSWLAYRVGKFAISSGGLVLAGKFDQMHEAKPFSALASAFDQYCDLLLGLDDAEAFKLIVDNLKSALGQDVYPLFKVIPKLEIILGRRESENISDETVLDINWENTFSRLQYLISRFIDVISTSSAISVVLFMDDLQWIDEASLSILKTVLTQKHMKFFFLGCYRDDEALPNANDHKFWKIMHGINAAGVNTTEIKLNCMNEETVVSLVSDLLCVSPRLVGSLSSVLFSRSKGNVLFFMQLLLLLYRDGLLYLDLGCQRWKWDEDKIVSMKLPDNIAICLSNGICKLPMEIQLALNTLSMFGASAKLSYLKLLESNLHMRIIEPLKEAETEGLVTNTKGSFKFCHDHIQEASLNLIEEQYRRINHLAYGKCLVQKASEANDIDLLFTAVHQINFGGPSAVTEHRDYFDMANHNLAAGKRAMRMAEFTSALSFFKHGISFLRDGHWQDHYAFSLELYELACKSSVASRKNVLALSFYSEQVLKNAHTFEDTLETELIIMGVMAYSNAAAAVNHGLSILSNLGEEIQSITDEVLDLKQVQSVVEGIPQEHFLNYKMMSDTKKLIVMRFLSRIQIIAHQCKPLLNALVTQKMLQITISYGLSPQAPLTFAYFGSNLAKLGDLSAGYRYALLAKALLNKFGTHKLTGEVLGIVSGIQYFCEPAPAVLETQIQNEITLISQGDLYWACLMRTTSCNNALWVNRDLSFVDKTYSEARAFFEQQEHKGALAYNAIGHRVYIFSTMTLTALAAGYINVTILAIMGRENEAMALENRLPLLRDMPIPSLKRSLYFYDLYLSYLMTSGNLKECFEAFLTTDVEEYVLMIARAYRTFIAGLAAFRIYRETRDSLWMHVGTERMKEMRIWAEHGSSWNFEHKLQLMKAEHHYCNGNFELAAQSYEKAIASARTHKYINDEALTCELAGRFFLERDHLASSLEYLRLAHEKYFDWGAVGKANQLMNFINAKFAVSCNSLSMAGQELKFAAMMET